MFSRESQTLWEEREVVNAVLYITADAPLTQVCEVEPLGRKVQPLMVMTSLCLIPHVSRTGKGINILQMPQDAGHNNKPPLKSNAAQLLQQSDSAICLILPLLSTTIVFSLHTPWLINLIFRHSSSFLVSTAHSPVVCPSSDPVLQSLCFSIDIPFHSIATICFFKPHCFCCDLISTNIVGDGGTGKTTFVKVSLPCSKKKKIFC